MRPAHFMSLLGISRFLFVLFAVLLPLASSLQAQAPGADKWAAGKRASFSTAGLEDAHGVALTISYPDSWEATGSNDANVLKVFTSFRGFGTEIIKLKIDPIAAGAPAPADLPKYFTPQALKALVPAGGKFLSGRASVVAGRQGAILEYTTTMPRGPKVMEIQVVSYVFIQGAAMVQIHCQVGAVPGGGAPPVAKRMQECRPLFDQIVKAIVFAPAK